jgi:hypothetical protein
MEGGSISRIGLVGALDFTNERRQVGKDIGNF